MLHPTKTNEPIPGYAVKTRIGVGGYGEVWSADAPGGLTKAIKFVYGYFDDTRAARELKALDRIKEVRHPFLLSLERFEVVDGQLIIVTELADMSLKDRFEQVRAEGADGIGRGELLDYMRDAADALDYMSQRFSLQHLDVKPENLLLVGGRVKVADFGLVKDLHDVTASMMGGLTPIYAAPEVFDDRPSQRSDQYSLAIVYQEMLVGSLPFPGRTPAQLATQHLHASPRLSALPKCDQGVIARALSKDPNQRFPDCRSLVDALLAANRGVEQIPDRPGDPSLSDTTSVRSHLAKTDARGVERTTHILGSDGEGLSDSQCIAAPAVEAVAQLDPLELTETDTRLRPTLFVGIGGTATRALKQLQRRLSDRFAPAGNPPAIEMLLLDTDVKNLYAATQGPPQDRLSDDATLSVSLRNAHDYTSDARDLLRWLSRRWLYNIPRSLQTEGRRPLGRLAFVDHAPQVLDRLRQALTRITGDESISQSVESTGLPFDGETPRVFVVASVSGGTGGGMVLDVAYAVRKVLADLNLPDDGLCGVLAHSTDRNPAGAELATANAYACLGELQHYTTTSYPGDAASGLPPRAAGGPFPNVYFVDLGRDFNEQEFDEATDTLAAYLYLASVTPASVALDRCRAETEQEEHVTLRSFSTATVGSMQSALPDLATHQLCREVVERWRTTGADDAPLCATLVHGTADSDAPFRSTLVHGTAGDDASPADYASRAEQHAETIGLDLASLREEVAKLVDAELGGDAEAVFARLRASVDGQRQPHASVRTRTMVDAVRRLFELPPLNDEELQPRQAFLLRNAVEQELKPLGGTRGDAIREWILELVNDPQTRVGGAAEAKEWYAKRLREMEEKCVEQLHTTQHNAASLEQTLFEAGKSAQSRGGLFARRAERKQASDIDDMLLLIVRMRTQEFTLQSLSKLLRIIAAGVSAAGDGIKDMLRELGGWSSQFDAASSWDEELPQDASLAEQVTSAVAQALCQQMPQLVDMLDRKFQDEYFSTAGGLRGVCQQADARRDEALERLRSDARAEVLRALRSIAIADAILSGGTDAEPQNDRLLQAVDAARPKFGNCGGAQRMLAILPSSSAESELARALNARLDPPPTVLTDSDADLTLCYEQQDLALPHVAARLIEGRDDFAKIAARLHTRIDVTWAELPTVTRHARAETAAL